MKTGDLCQFDGLGPWRCRVYCESVVNARDLGQSPRLTQTIDTADVLLVIALGEPPSSARKTSNLDVLIMASCRQTLLGWIQSEFLRKL